MKKVKTLGPFETKKSRVISRQAGEIIRMSNEDYEEVKNLVELLEEPAPIELKVSVSENIGVKDGLKKGRK